MDQQIQKIIPNYQRIFQDILNEKFPEKKEILQKIIGQKSFTSFDIIKINQMIFGKPNFDQFSANQKHRSYSKTDILQILDFQQKYKLTNSKVAEHFNVSRNSITKWKKIYL